MEPHEQTVGLEKFGIRTHSAFKERLRNVPADYLIEDLISQPSLTLAVGDSGIGKSPFLYQALLCISAGIPFLGRKVRQSRTMYMDCENGVPEAHNMVEQLAKHLGLAAIPEDFLEWNLNDCPEEWDSQGYKLQDAIAEAKPAIVVLDPLNALFRGIESDNPTANQAFQELRKLMKQVGCSFICVHHPRKFDPKHVGKDHSLENGDIHRWFDATRGPRVLVNGSDLRLGIEPPASLTDRQLIIRGFRRVHGEIPMMRICRVLDEDGEAVGYNLMRADESLPQELRAVFDRLPEEFQFKDAMAAYGRKNEATSDFLKKFISAGLLKKIRKGWYQKVHPPGNDGTAAMPIQLVPAA